MDAQPLISCIMPTYNRRCFVPPALQYFLRQDYENKELIIVDDGTDSISDLIPDDHRIRYFRLDKKLTLGAKLNLACEYADGDIIAHWDDDDWYAPHRLSYQAQALAPEKVDICGLSQLLYYDLQSGRAYKYIYPSEQRIWLLGSELFYRKMFWATHRFAEIQVGMDAKFVWSADQRRVLPLADYAFAVHLIHAHNVSPKRTQGAYWHPHPVEDIQQILGPDWEFYQPNSVENTNGRQLAQYNVGRSPVKANRNVFACLVHESQECIIDLVRNLRYFDPSSAILLYNGGNDPRLLDHRFPIAQYGAMVHPQPRPLTWGRLHDFALDCMQFALDHFSFDTLTIVDSDQLLARHGYSQHMAQFLAQLPQLSGLSFVFSMKISKSLHYKSEFGVKRMGK